MRRLAGALVSLVRRSFNFAAPPQALAIEHAFDAPSVREAVILRLLDRVHAGERVAETFALGTAYRSNRLVQASLGQFDGKRRAESVGGPAPNRRPRRIRLQSIDPELYAMIPHALLQEFYEVHCVARPPTAWPCRPPTDYSSSGLQVEDLVVSQGYTWPVMAPQFQVRPLLPLQGQSPSSLLTSGIRRSSLPERSRTQRARASLAPPLS
jgi:hypothetical protein